MTGKRPAENAHAGDEAVYLRKRTGALIYRGRMVARIVYADDALVEALRRATEEHFCNERKERCTQAR